MTPLLLFWIVFLQVQCLILAESGEKKNMTDITGGPPTTVDDNLGRSSDYESDFNGTGVDEEGRILEIDRKRKIKVIVLGTKKPSDHKKLLEKVQKEYEKQEQNRRIKLAFKIIGGVILIFICGCIYVCTRCMCKKKRQTVSSNPEEAVPSLSQETNSAIPLQYPQQPGIYPMQQMQYPSTTNSVPSLSPQSNLVQPLPYPQQSQQIQYPPTGNSVPALPPESKFGQPLPYPPQHQQIQYPSTANLVPTLSPESNPVQSPPQPGLYPHQQVPYPSTAS